MCFSSLGCALLSHCARQDIWVVEFPNLKDLSLRNVSLWCSNRRAVKSFRSSVLRSVSLVFSWKGGEEEQMDHASLVNDFLAHHCSTLQSITLYNASEGLRRPSEKAPVLFPQLRTLNVTVTCPGGTDAMLRSRHPVMTYMGLVSCPKVDLEVKYFNYTKQRRTDLIDSLGELKDFARKSGR